MPAIALARRSSTDLDSGIPVSRWLCLCSLLVIELVLLTVLFDTESLVGNRQWWAEVIGRAHYLPPLAITVAIAFAAFGGAGLWRELSTASRALGAQSRWKPPLAAHLVAYSAFVLLTSRLLAGGADASGLFYVWLLAGLLVAGCWAVSLLPLDAWVGIVRRSRSLLIAAGIVGVLGFSAGQLTERLWKPMASATLTAVHAALGVAYSDVSSVPEEQVIGTNGFLVEIAPDCSGYEGLGLVAAFLGSYLWLRRDQHAFPLALLILPLGLAAAFGLNVARIVALIVVGAEGWPGVARGGFHSQAGWIAFNAVSLGMIVLVRRWPAACRTERAEPAATENPAAAYLWPLVVVVGASMVTGAVASEGFDPLYAVRVLAAGVVIWIFRHAYLGLGWNLSLVPVGIGAAVFALWMGLEVAVHGPVEPTPAPAAFDALSDGWRVAWLVGRIIGAVLVIPLTEELAFRGYLMRRLTSTSFDRVPPTAWSWFAVIASSAVFGVLHPGRFAAGFLAGVAYGWAYQRRGRLADAVVAHAVTNALLAAYVLATGAWQLW